MREINGVAVRDTLAELVEPASTALLVVDVQNDFCHPDGHFARHGKDLGTIRAMLPGLVSFVRAAQGLGVRCAFIQQATLPEGKSDSPAWLRFKTRDGKAPDYTIPGSWGWQLVDGLMPGPRDWRVEKFRPDAFVNTTLDGLLRAARIESVVVLGTITEGCVESTVRGASYRDFYTVVGSDLIASPNAVNHEGSMALFRARYPLASAAELLACWR